MVYWIYPIGEQLDIHTETKEFWPSLILCYTKISSKWITNWNRQWKTIKLRGENFQDLRLGKESVDVTPKAKTLKGKTEPH